MRFLQAFQPEMVGIGPFIPHHDTPFAGEPAGSLERTLTMVALTRLTLPKALIPATTALGTIHPQGREMGLKAGANVVMPNLSPVNVRGQYSLYDNKACTGQEAAEGLAALKESVGQAGFGWWRAEVTQYRRHKLNSYSYLMAERVALKPKKRRKINIKGM